MFGSEGRRRTAVTVALSTASCISSASLFSATYAAFFLAFMIACVFSTIVIYVCHVILTANLPPRAPKEVLIFSRGKKRKFANFRESPAGF